jgi:hypothetical protein
MAESSTSCQPSAPQTAAHKHVSSNSDIVYKRLRDERGSSRDENTSKKLSYTD